MKKTKILALADLHGDTGLAKKLAKKAEKEKVDLIIIAGDLTFAEMSSKGIIGPFAKTKKDILVLPGNHESIATTDFLCEVYKPYSKSLHGKSFRKNDLGIFGAGGGDMGVYFVRETDLFKLLNKGHEEIKGAKKKVMVTHMHPEGSKSELSGFPGSTAVRQAVKKLQPDFLIHSHIHEAEGFEEKIGKTKVINVGRKGKILEI